ncbi:MAG: BatD family protein, partial [Gemmatimonadota bacterium]|nr:BatD family protein [Gemmatimonadota bacterium]
MLGILLAAQLAIVAHAADTVGACEPLDLSVAVSARGTQLPHLVAPTFAPFDVMRSVTIPHVERDTRAVPSVTVEYRFVLVADRPGAYTIPPFEARIGNETARSAPLRIHVVPSNADATPTVLTRAGIDTGTRLDLRATHPDTVYVGQQANYTVAVFLNDAVRRRLRRNPTFYPPDMQSMLAYDVPSAGTEQQTVGGSSCFEALVYRRALFPLQSGRLVIPPAQLTYALPSGASFFSREETHELQTDSAVVIAVDPPAAGQPAGFDGAVGRFRVDTRVGAPSGRVGDPLTVTVRVSGTGNVKLLPRPHLTVPWASAVPSDERVQVDSTGARIGGAKEFDWVLTPRTPGDLDVPAVRYVYFDPGLRRYAVAGAGVVRVRIAPGALAAIDTTHRASGLPVRTVYHGPAGAPLSSHPIFWLLLTLAPVPALRARWRDRRRRARGARPVPPMTRLASAAAV